MHHSFAILSATLGAGLGEVLQRGGNLQAHPSRDALETHRMNWTDYAIFMMALTLWREARGDGEDGMRAVGHVIANRRNASFHRDWVAVITARNQFTSMSVHSDPETVLWPVTGDAVFAIAMRLAADIIEGTDPDNTLGAQYYANLATMDRYGWFKQNILDEPEVHPQTAVIGKQTFFR